MSVPPFVPAPPPVSPQAQELGESIAQLVRQYQAGHPGLSGTDVAQAFGVARRSLGGSYGPSHALKLALVLGVLVLLGGVFFLRSAGGGAAQSFPMAILVAIAVLGALAVVVAVKKGQP
jgi:hypothetical protein